MNKRHIVLAKILRIIIILLFVSKMLIVISWQFRKIEKKPTQTFKGFPVTFYAQLRIPDSVQMYESDRGTIGYYRYNNTLPILKNNFSTDSQYRKTDLVKNKFRLFSTSEDSLRAFSSFIRADEVTLIVYTDNAFYKFIWWLNSQISFITYCAIALILIILLSAYIKGKFLTRRNFMLFSSIGFIIIFRELFRSVIAYFNTKIIIKGNISTTINDKIYKTVDMDFAPVYNFIAYKEIFIGLVIIILSSIIKTAIEMKQENDLTI